MFLVLFLNHWLNFLILFYFYTQIFNPIAELVIPIETSTKEAKIEVETHPAILEITINKWSI